MTLRTLALLVAFAAPASAAPLRVQGTLTDAVGRPFTGVAQLDFRILDRASRVEVWSEPQSVEVVRGVFVAILGEHRRLPRTSAVKPTWRLYAEGPIGSGWTFVPLTEPTEDLRRVELSRLLLRLGVDPGEPLPDTPVEYRWLLSGHSPRFAPPETVSVAPDCAEAAPPGGACPKPLQKVLDREERLLRSRLSRLNSEGSRPEAGWTRWFTAR